MIVVNGKQKEHQSEETLPSVPYSEGGGTLFEVAGRYIGKKWDVLHWQSTNLSRGTLHKLKNFEYEISQGRDWPRRAAPIPLYDLNYFSQPPLEERIIPPK